MRTIRPDLRLAHGEEKLPTKILEFFRKQDAKAWEDRRECGREEAAAAITP
jgi:hypothetical protein